MRIDVLTVLPELLDSFFAHSIVKRAQAKGCLDLYVHGLRKWGLGKHHQVDDYPYGGEAGMVLRCEPIVHAIEELQDPSLPFDEVIYLAPDGELLTQSLANTLLLCGHYKGIDQRIRDQWVTREVSIGDYVLSGGELPAAVLVDTLARLLPGVLHDETSALSDSFQDGWVSHPVYTRPALFRDIPVPSVLVEGNHQKMEEWKMEQSYQQTLKRRPRLITPPKPS
jgi:tRNA (guanine37-N1)-methyltransferase